MRSSKKLVSHVEHRWQTEVERALTTEKVTRMARARKVTAKVMAKDMNLKVTKETAKARLSRVF